MNKKNNFKNEIIKLFILLFLIFFIFLSSDKKSNLIFVERLYATSILSPELEYGPENLIDNNLNTNWVTMKGAGPFEGVMFVFENPIYLSKIKIHYNNDSNFEKIDSLSVFINGQQLDLSSYADISTIYIDSNVKTLYIRIDSVIDQNDYDITGILYKGSKSVALKEIDFFDKKENKLNLIAPIKVKGKIFTSSTLSPVEAYNAEFLFDSRQDFGWADGNTKKSGKGEFIKFNFEKEETITKLKIWNGYQRSHVHYFANERAKKIAFGIEGSKLQEYILKDKQSPQIIKLKTPLTGKKFILKILDVYKGTAYKDLVISEILFYNGKNWYKLYSEYFDKIKSKNLQLKYTTIKKLIDKCIYDSLTTDNFTKDLHLIFRSNGSFTLWIEKWDTIYNDDNSVSKIFSGIYADGNWKCLTKNKIKIFGRLHYFDKTFSLKNYDPYAGTVPSEEEAIKQKEKTKIFQDYIIILPFDNNKIKIQSKNLLFYPFEFIY